MMDPVDEKDFFYQSSTRICGSLDIEKGLYRFLHHVAATLPVDRISLCLFEPELGALRVFAEASHAEGRVLDVLVPLSPASRALLQREDLERVRIDHDTGSDPILRDWVRFFKLPESSFLRLRLVLEGKRIGSLVMHAEGRNRYPEECARRFSLLNEPFAIAISNTLKHRETLMLKDRLADENRYLRRELTHLSGDEIIGSEFGLSGVMEMVRRVAPLESPVLVLGESGVGKDLVAHAVHGLSPRREGPFVVVNCGAIPETLIDSELFGHEKGAFTGAVMQKRGRFERAHTGTIFLDEVGELPLQAQVRLLRVLQDKQIERVGGTQSIPVDIRVIAATHQNLEHMITQKLFRDDLWFRLSVFPIRIPPLRERKADIPALVDYFVEKKSRELKLGTAPRLAPGGIDQLLEYRWPGNVRELENVIERALILNRFGPLTFEHLLPRPGTDFKGAGLPPAVVPKLHELEAHHIQGVLVMTKGKVHGPGGAAELLGLNPSTLRNKMNRLGVPYGRRRGSFRQGPQ